jgi:Leucine-rich repeat (LRR) protein
MNTNKERFGAWKRYSQILTLWGSYALRFKRSGNFRTRVLEKIQSSASQLELIFNGAASYTDGGTPISLGKLPAVKKIQIGTNFLVTTWPTDVEQLYLDFCLFPQISVTSRTRDLTIFSDYSTVLVLDAASFVGLKDLTVYCCSIPNYHLLSHLKRLKIEACPGITDVSCFRNISDLTITECSEITDVSSLGNVRLLDLSGCYGIKDVSSLGKVHSLTLFGCSHIEDVSALGNVHTLDLSDCVLVKDLSALNNVYSLKFQNFQGTDVSGLVNVVILDISSSPYVCDLNMLHRVVTLDISDCTQITELTNLDRLKELSCTEFSDLVLHNQPQFQALKGFCVMRSHVGQLSSLSSPNLLHLELRNCRLIREFSAADFPNLRTLIFLSCDNLSSFSVLPPSLKRLYLDNCRGLPSLTVHKELVDPTIYELRIPFCYELASLHVKCKVFRTKLIDCPRLCEFIIERQIAHLKVVHCYELKGFRGEANIEHLTKVSRGVSREIDEEDAFDEIAV